MAKEPDESSSQSRPMGDSKNPFKKKFPGKPDPSGDKSSPLDPDSAKTPTPTDSPAPSADNSSKADDTSDTEKRISQDSDAGGGGEDSSPGRENRTEPASDDLNTDSKDSSPEIILGEKVIAEPGPDPDHDDHHPTEAGPHDDPHHYSHHHHEEDPQHGKTANESENEDAEEEDEWEDDEEEGGGPVKSFLEHLEDLRWVIIRVVISVLIAMVVCLAAANKVVELLTEPLTKAQKIAGKTDSFVVLVQTGPANTNLHAIKLSTNRWGDLNFPTNQQAMKLVPQPKISGTNFVMEWKAIPATREEIPYEMLVSLKNMGPVSPFVVALKIALFGGIGLASPFVFFFIGQFIVPALHQQERKYLYQALAIGSGLFCVGVAFCYFAMLQIALNAAMKFSRWMNFEPDIWRAEEYIGFVVKFLLGMGLSFELPVVLLTLVKLGLLDYERMNKFRPYWVIVNLVLAAMLTPPDVVSQLLMAIPLQVLYEISVLIAWYWHKRDQKRLREEGEETD